MTSPEATTPQMDQLPFAIPALPEWPVVGQRFLDGATSYRELTYNLVLGYRPLTLDLHVPDGDGPFPVAVYAHAGGFFLGTPVMGEWRHLLDAGIAVASIRYRLRSEVKHPGPVEDVVAATVWVREHAAEYNLDSSRVLGVGSSAGAYLIDFAALTYGADGQPYADGSKNLFEAVVSYYAPTDFIALPEDSPEDVMEVAGTPQASESQYLGYVPAERPDDAAAAVLGNRARNDAPPFLILHGDADTRVGVGQARRFDRALYEAGAQSQLIIVPGAQHGDPLLSTPDLIRKVHDFLHAALSDQRR
jgi:acetyl esterase/lipase